MKLETFRIILSNQRSAAPSCYYCGKKTFLLNRCKEKYNFPKETWSKPEYFKESMHIQVITKEKPREQGVSFPCGANEHTKIAKVPEIILDSGSAISLGKDE